MGSNRPVYLAAAVSLVLVVAVGMSVVAVAAVVSEACADSPWSAREPQAERAKLRPAQISIAFEAPQLRVSASQ